MMKSAYELAMERLSVDDPDAVQELTDEQREAIADLENRYRAKVAEREIFLKGKLREEVSKGNLAEAGKLRAQIVNERERLKEELEAEKQKVRQRR